MPSPNEILAALRAAAAAGDRDAASFVHMYQPWVLTLAEPQVVNPLRETERPSTSTSV